MKYLIVLFSIFVMMISCKKSTLIVKKAKYHIDITDNNIENLDDLNQIIDSIDYIPLETGKEFTIGEVSKIIVKNDRFYILDRKGARGVFVFNNKGKFLNKYQKIGKGPYEYVRLEDVALDKDNNICLLAGRKVIILDEHCKPLKEIKLPFYACRYEIFGDLFAFSNVLNCGLVITSSDGDVIQKEFSLNNRPRKILLSPFSKFGDTLFFKDSFNDTIYKIGEKFVKYHMIPDFEHPFPYNKIQDYKIQIGGISINYIPDKYMNDAYYYCETLDKIVFRFNYKYEDYVGPFFVVYSKLSGFTYVYTNRTKNGIYKSVYAPAIEETTEDGRFVGTIEPSFYLEASKKHNWDININIRETSNPIVAIISFKEF